MAETFIGARDPRSVPYAPPRGLFDFIPKSLFPSSSERHEAYEKATEAAGLGRGVYRSLMLREDPEYARRVEAAISPVREHFNRSESAMVLAASMAAPVPAKVSPGIVGAAKLRARELIEKNIASPKLSKASFERLHKVYRKAVANEKYDTTVWPAFQKNLPRLERGLLEELDTLGNPAAEMVVGSVTGAVKANVWPVKKLANALFPQPVTASGKAWHGAAVFGSTVLADYGIYRGVRSFEKRTTRDKGARSAAGAPKGSGEAVLSAAEELDRGTDAWVVRSALNDLTAAGGASNTEAANAFRTRTKAIREKAMARMYPGWNEGIAFEDDLSAYRDYKDTEVGQKAGARLRSALERLNNMDPMNWVEGVK